jgi:hypothetical protein
MKVKGKTAAAMLLILALPAIDARPSPWRAKEARATCVASGR